MEQQGVTQLIELWGHSEDVWGDILRIVGASLEKDAAPCLTLPIHTVYPISDTMEGTLRRMTMGDLCQRAHVF